MDKTLLTVTCVVVFIITVFYLDDKYIKTEHQRRMEVIEELRELEHVRTLNQTHQNIFQLDSLQKEIEKDLK